MLTIYDVHSDYKCNMGEGLSGA